MCLVYGEPAVKGFLVGRSCCAPAVLVVRCPHVPNVAVDLCGRGAMEWTIDFVVINGLHFELVHPRCTALLSFLRL